MFARFITRYPTPQVAADLFRGKWVSYVPLPGLETGTMHLFDAEDPRPRQAADFFGGIQGFDILELGPLEGGHSYQLKKLGAGSVLGVEASPELYLKCLIVKELTGLDAHFLLGDFNRYLEQEQRHFDMVFACGVLYHMPDPIHTLYLLAGASPRVFLWTHYVAEGMEMPRKRVDIHGFQCDYHLFYYDEDSHSRGWAGVQPSASRMRRQDILDCLAHLGFDRIEVLEDMPDHMGGPAFTVAAEHRAGTPPLETWDRLRRLQSEADYYAASHGEMHERLARLEMMEAAESAPAAGAAPPDRSLGARLRRLPGRLHRLLAHEAPAGGEPAPAPAPAPASQPTLAYPLLWTPMGRPQERLALRMLDGGVVEGVWLQAQAPHWCGFRGTPRGGELRVDLLRFRGDGAPPKPAGSLVLDLRAPLWPVLRAVLEATDLDCALRPLHPDSRGNWAGVWQYQERDGQGLMLAQRDQRVSGYWLCYDDAGEPLWFGLDGEVQDGVFTSLLRRPGTGESGGELRLRRDGPGRLAGEARRDGQTNALAFVLS